MRHYQAIFKHSLSCLADMHYEAMVDDLQKEVVLTLGHFDSGLVADIVTRVLPREMGVTAFHDDNSRGSYPAVYGLSVKFNGLSFNAKVVKLIGHGGQERVAVVFSKP